MRLAIHAPSLGLSLPDQPFGKDVANRGLYTALATHGGFEQITFCTADQLAPTSLQSMFGAATGSAQLNIAPLMQTDSAVKSGTLLRGQPYLSELAWERATRFGHQAYSLVGVIHTLGPPKVRELIGEALIAPVQPWDALICTSPTVRECLDGLLDRGRPTSIAASEEPAPSGLSCLSFHWVLTRRICFSSELINAPVISCVGDWV